jgi:hypothetical protein
MKTNFPLIFLMLVISVDVYAEINKCVDSNGKVSYTEALCEGRGDTQSKLRPVTPPAVKVNGPSLAEQNEAFKKRRAEQQAYEKCLNDKSRFVCVGPKEWAVRK